MKSWEPEETFSHADFPRRGGDTTKTNPARNDTIHKPVTKKTGEKTSEKSSEKTSGKSLKKKAPTDPTVRESQWQPERVSAGDAHIIPSGASSSNVQASAPISTDYQLKLLRETAMGRPEFTLRILRKWYWEKWPAQANVNASTLAPHDRIRIVCSALGEKALLYLLQLMSPHERGDISAILKENRSYSSATKNMAYREFMKAIRAV